MIAFIGGCLIDFVMILYRGVMVACFWSWFVIPVFPNMTVLSVPAAVGLSLVLQAMRGSNFDTKSSLQEIIVNNITDISVVFAFGFFLKHFI